MQVCIKPYYGLAWLTGLLLLSAGAAGSPAAPVHNIVLFVADGLRAGMVNGQNTPTMAALRRDGVWFKNSHSLFPTFTMPNASALASGHYLGDSGIFSNTLYSGFAVPGANNSVTPFIENDAVLGDIDEHFGGNVLDEESVLAVARQQGYATAAVGKLGPAALQDVTARDGQSTMVIDDATGNPGGLPLSASLQAEMQAAGLPLQTPGRGDNGRAGDASHAGTTSANIEQQRYFLDVTTRVLLPRLGRSQQPFVLVYWSRDPDGSQHNQGDSLGQLVPGINGPTSLAAIRNADDNLAALLNSLQRLGLADTTDVIVTADHGFSTIAKQSDSSPAARLHYADVPAGQLPPGFLGIDLAIALGLPLHDPDAGLQVLDYSQGLHTKKGNAVLGDDIQAPQLIVAANGGSDLLYLPQNNAAQLAPRVVAALLAQDYVSGVFVDDALGEIPGSLPLSAVNLRGSALTPLPAIVVNFRSWSSGCALPSNCGVEIADTGLQQGQGMHGNFSRADTYNFMAAIGPDFKHHFVDAAPSSNADIGQTMAALLHLQIPTHGRLLGRVLKEAAPAGRMPPVHHGLRSGSRSGDGWRTQLAYQWVEQGAGPVFYFDSAGFAGRTLGLPPGPAAQHTHPH